METVKGKVLRVCYPKVADKKGNWAIHIIRPILKRGRIYRQKQWVYGKEKPKIGQWIEVTLH